MFNQLSIVCALLRRDYYVLSQRYKEDIINVLIMVAGINIIFGFLGPLIGLKAHYVADSFLGTIISSFSFIGFTRALDDISDRCFMHTIDFRRTLPLSAWYFFGAHIISYVMHYIAISVPLLIVGKLILSSQFSLLFTIHWSYFIFIYLGAMFMMAIFFVCLAFTASFEWFRLNIWQRVLTPLHQFGCLFYAWNKAHSFSPKISYFLLCNPITYCSEGLRTSLMYGQGYLPPLICLMVLSIFIIVGAVMLNTFIKKRLDWV